MNIASSIKVDLMGRRSRLPFLEGGGGVGVVQYRGVMKEKSPDFRSSEVGISVLCYHFGVQLKNKN